MTFAIEQDFPFEKIDEIAEIESYRKEINRPIYHIHKWWAKRLGSVFRSIISGTLSEKDWPDFHAWQSFEGKVVLDPFMGSGTTLGEAAKLGASVVGCDVNPVSTFLVRQALTRVDITVLEKEFQNIENDIKDEIHSFYKTLDPSSNEEISALYYFWVKTVKTPTGEKIPLHSDYIFSKNAMPKKKPKSQILCPNCGNIFIGLYNSSKESCSACSFEFNPQIGPAKGAKVKDKLGNEYKIKDLIQAGNAAPEHELYAIMCLDKQGKKKYIKPTQFDFNLFNKASRKLSKIQNDLPLPKMEVRPGYNTNQAKGYNYNHWKDFFNKRQLLCLGLLLKRILEIENSLIRDHFVCLFSSCLDFNNLFCSFKGEGTGAVRHMFSHHILKPERTPLENSIWGIQGKSSGTFTTLFRSKLIKAKKYLDEPFELEIVKTETKKSTNKIVCSKPIDLKMTDTWKDFCKANHSALILNGDSSNLEIPDKSIDAVVTDPPYFDFIHYSELSDFFYAWITEALGDKYEYLAHPDSSHSNEVQDKEYEKFSTKICSIFTECYRVLKEQGLMCFSYHHSSVDGWIAIYDAITEAGFEIVAAHPVKAEMSVASPKSATKDPINLDSIIVCKKDLSSDFIQDEKKELISKYDSHVTRFSKIGRCLSLGDKFVIICSLSLSIASIKKMSSNEARSFLDWATENYSVHDYRS